MKHGDGQVVIVAPGLNNKPETMQPIIDALNGHGYRCVRVPLRFAQRLSSDRIASDWVSAFADVYDTCTARYDQGRIHSVAFSLGGLITLAFLQRTPAASLNALFLIAPPLALRRYAAVVRYLTPLRRLGLSLPSLAPRRIRARSFTTLADYHAMLMLTRELDRARMADNIRRTRGCVIAGAQDELVDGDGVSEWIRQRLDWNVVMLDTKPGGWWHGHVLLSEGSMGHEAWDVLTKQMIAHLSSAS